MQNPGDKERSDSSSESHPASLQNSSTVTTNSTSNDTDLVRVFSPPTRSTLLADIPDEEFEPTSSELQAAYASQQRRVAELVNSPLKTQVIKKREEDVRQSRWPTTKMRIRFPNQVILEKSFQSTDNIKAVYQFIRGSLIEDALSDKFILYQPPKRELKVSDPDVKPKTLAQLDLAPSSMLLIRFQTDTYNDPTRPPPLLPQLLEQSVPLPTPGGEKEKGSSSTTSKLKPLASSLEKKVPKWLRLGQKK